MTNSRHYVIKFVRRANMWVVTYFIGTKQNQAWFSSEAEAQEFVKKEN